MSNDPVLTGCSLFALSILMCGAVQQKSFNSWEEAYWAERRGRCRVEREIKKLTDIQLNTSDGFFVQEIGTIQSCYRQCVGTPRQGLLVPSSRASLKLISSMSPESLDGLEEFSHVWITFRFHLNTNTLKGAKAFMKQSMRDGDKNNNRFTFQAKITPPMLKEKKGVLATRSPHRPNPIGVTLAQVYKIDKKKRTIEFRACDLVQGTPVLDIKPYVPSYDTVPEYRIPSWIAASIDTRNEVNIPEHVRQQVFDIQHKLKQYKNDAECYLEVVKETLEGDVRSKFQTKKNIALATSNVSRGSDLSSTESNESKASGDDNAQELLTEVPLDNAFVRYAWVAARQMKVVSVSMRSVDSGKDGLETVDNVRITQIDTNVIHEISAEEPVV